jgi:hypothetical protein
MVDYIIGALLSSAASSAGKDLYKQLAARLRTFLRGEQAPEGVRQAVIKLERGEVDEIALRETLNLLSRSEISKIKDELKSINDRPVATNQNVVLNVSATQIEGSVITGITNTFHNK